MPKGGILEAKTEQKSIQNRGANLTTKKSPLEIVLDQFGLDFLAVLGTNMLIFHWFLKVFVKITVLKKIELEKATWTKLGSIMTPKRVQKGSQMGSKIGSKFIKKYDRFLDRFWIEKMAGTLGRRSNSRTSRSRGGGKGEA